MAPRIATRAEDLLFQLTQAGTAITTLGLGWPSGAPTAAEVITAVSALGNDISNEAALEAQLDLQRQARRTHIEEGRALMRTIDGFTDGLYGKDGAEKSNFGLSPIGPSGPAFGGPVDQVVVTKIRDGSPPNSIFVDFSTVDGASSYEAEWFTDAALTPATRVGNVTVTQSEFTTPGLTKGQQYWFRVRAIRANQPGPWSDPATRVAGL